MPRFEYRDGRFCRDGEPFFLIAAEYQYYRDRREHWTDRLEKLRAAAVNAITFYVPWRHHLRVEGERRRYDFTGETLDSRDLAGFLERIASLGLFMIAKPGPFVHSELNIGGLPDLASPSFAPEMPPARRHHGGPALWSWDASVLPAPLGERFDALAREWLGAVRGVLAPYAVAGGPLIAVQLNDETVYCSSNDPPWNLGYEPEGLRFYRRLLEERYGSVERYNRLHGGSIASFEEAPAPRLEREGDRTAVAPPLGRREDALLLIDWAEYQWRLRRDLYARYREHLGLDVPHLTNFAGITPPIEENVPDLDERAVERPPPELAGLYPEWWFAANRVDCDADAYHYGFVSWLGVAAYDRDVFARYVNTARRARGVNMEENWGFAGLYDERSRHAIVPFYQTLLSVAAGATGYVVFCGVGSEYWDEDLDRTTKRRHRTFPSHAPIDERGRCRPMYDAMALLDRWFGANGAALLRCEIDADAAYLVYAPYAAVSSWVPRGGRHWAVKGHAVPRCGREGFEEFSRSLQEAGYSIAVFELDAAPPERLREPRALAMHTAFFMDTGSQRRLADLIAVGGTVFLSGELPSVDLEWRPCTVLRDAVRAAAAAGRADAVHRDENLFADGRFAERLAAAGIAPRVRTSAGIRVFRHRGRDDLFVFFFGLESGEENAAWVETDGLRIELVLGSRTCGALRIRGGRLASWLVKGANEVESTRSRVAIRLGDESIEGHGDFSGDTPAR